MPMDTAQYLTKQGWKGKGTALQQGHISRPIAVVQKKTMSGVGKDRDEAVPFWDNIFASAARSIASNTPTPLASGASTPIPSTASTPTPAYSSMTAMARSKREFARLKLYSAFVKGETTSFKDDDKPLPSKSDFSGSSAPTPLGIQHRVMKSQLWNIQPASASTSTPPGASTSAASSPGHKTPSSPKKDRSLRKREKEIKRAEKEKARAEKEAKRLLKEQKRAVRGEKKEKKADDREGSTTRSGKRKRDEEDEVEEVEDEEIRGEAQKVKKELGLTIVADQGDEISSKVKKEKKEKKEKKQKNAKRRSADEE